MISSTELLGQLEQCVSTVCAGADAGAEPGMERIRAFLGSEYGSSDRALMLGLAFTRWSGECLAELVYALDIPREQRMFIAKAGERLKASESEGVKNCLRGILLELWRRFSDLRRDIRDETGVAYAEKAMALA